ncbi:MAG: hypothetical protein Q7U04_15990 [Bacteriovorax sp.]|nr:hypothetical protein [Bacteriovorax sp.]
MKIFSFFLFCIVITIFNGNLSALCTCLCTQQVGYCGYSGPTTALNDCSRNISDAACNAGPACFGTLRVQAGSCGY